MGTLQNSELVNFTGGMNTVVAPHLLPVDESVQLTNVDVKYGSLKSTNIIDPTSTALNKFFFEYRNELIWYDEWRANALVDNKLYWSNGIVSGKVLEDGSELNLGIPTPENILRQLPLGIPLSDVPEEDLDEHEAGVHKGDFKYTYTFYSSTTGVESAPARLPGYVYLDEQNVQLSNFEVLPEEADRYRIYRIGGYLAQFTLVATVEDPTNFEDDLDDTVIDGRLLQTLRSGPPPALIANFVELNGRLYGSVKNKLYFSGLGAPDSWYVNDFFVLPDTITAIAKTPAGLLVMGRRYVYLMFGASPSTFRLKVISDYLGCVSNRSIAYYNGKVLWLGEDGILASDGYDIDNLTYRKIERISDMNIFSSIVVNDIYYVVFKPLLVPSETLYPADDLLPGGVRGVNISNEAQGMIAMDFKRGRSYSYQYLNYPNIISIGLYKGEMYVIADSSQTPISCSQTFSCLEPFCYGDYILSKFSNNSPFSAYKKLQYLSPQLIDGSFSTLKEYDKVRINFIGTFTVKVIFSSGDVVVEDTIESEELISNDLELNDGEDRVAIIGIPNGSNKSYSIQFLIEGYGILRSIQYSWKPWELQ